MQGEGEAAARTRLARGLQRRVHQRQQLPADRQAQAQALGVDGFTAVEAVEQPLHRGRRDAAAAVLDLKAQGQRGLGGRRRRSLVRRLRRRLKRRDAQGHAAGAGVAHGVVQQRHQHLVETVAVGPHPGGQARVERQLETVAARLREQAHAVAQAPRQLGQGQRGGLQLQQRALAAGMLQQVVDVADEVVPGPARLVELPRRNGGQRLAKGQLHIAQEQMQR